MEAFSAPNSPKPHKKSALIDDDYDDRLQVPGGQSRQMVPGPQKAYYCIRFTARI